MHTSAVRHRLLQFICPLAIGIPRRHNPPCRAEPLIVIGGVNIAMRASTENGKGEKGHSQNVKQSEHPAVTLPAAWWGTVGRTRSSRSAKGASSLLNVVRC